MFALLKFGGKLDMTGSLIQVSWEGLWLEAGLIGPISKFPECIYSYPHMANTHVE